MNDIKRENWFEVIFGFKENVQDSESAETLKQNFVINMKDDSVFLKSKKNGCEYNVGHFEIKKSIKSDFRNLQNRNGRGKLNIIQGHGKESRYYKLIDLLSIQSLPAWNGATYLVPSNFNCLEFKDQNYSACDGVTNYYKNQTQGSYAAIACGPSTVYRNYFVKHDNVFGQIDKEIQLLDDIPIPVQNGFAIIEDDEDIANEIKLKNTKEEEGENIPISKYLSNYIHTALDRYFYDITKMAREQFDWEDDSIWRVGVDRNCEVVLKRGRKGNFDHAPKNQFANHVYASAFDFASKVTESELTLYISEKMLEAEYRATIFAAWENSLNYNEYDGSKKLYLTLLGGGAFNNRYSIICEAIKKNIGHIKESGLDVYVMCYDEQIYDEVYPFLKDSINETKGQVIDTNDEQQCSPLYGNNDNQETDIEIEEENDFLSDEDEDEEDTAEEEYSEEKENNDNEKKFKLHIDSSTIGITQENQPVCGIDRRDFSNNATQYSKVNETIEFDFIIGLFRFKDIYYLAVATETEPLGFFDVHRVKSTKVFVLNEKETQQSEKFSKLLEFGLNQCYMYYSDKYNLANTFQQQFENIKSREAFIWNLEGLNNLKNKWEAAYNSKCYKELIGGYFKKTKSLVIISRKSNKNGGCHTWNRGADINGNAANFVENEEIMILNPQKVQYNNNVISSNIKAVSHIEIGGSVPFFWSQYPTMQFSRPYRFGPEEESERRFNLHFDHLDKIYGQEEEQTHKIDDSNKTSINDKCSIVIVSLLSDKGKEEKLNSIYKKFADKRQIEFKRITFSKLMKTKGELTNVISEFANSELDYTEVKNGEIIQKQTKIPRVNCSSCLDRTSVFMEISFKAIFENISNSFVFKLNNHKQLWHLRANKLSEEYAMTKGQKTYLIENDYQTFKGKCFDIAIQVQRFFYSIFYEGRCCDAFNAVLQEKPFTEFENFEIFQRIIHFLQLILIFIYTFLFRGRRLAAHTWKQQIKTIIDHPHIPDLRDADEYDNIDFMQKNDKTQT